MRIAVAFDHAGTPLRDAVLGALREDGHDPQDLGTADDYPDVARAVCAAVLAGEARRGVLACGSGAGVAVAACKIRGIRATVAHDTYTAAQCVEPRRLQRGVPGRASGGARLRRRHRAGVRGRRVLGRRASRAQA